MFTAAECALADLRHAIRQFHTHDPRVVECLCTDVDHAVRNTDIFALADIADQGGAVHQEISLLPSALADRPDHRTCRRRFGECLCRLAYRCSVELYMKTSGTVSDRHCALAKPDHRIRVQKRRALADLPQSAQKGLIGI